MMKTSVSKTLVVAGLSLMAGGLCGLAMADDKKPGASAAGSGWSAEVAPEGTDSINLDNNQASTVEKVSSYFKELKTLKGSFVQTAADGEVMKGDFLMKRPGMFRFDYARPSRQVVISDGTYLAIQDLDLNNEDRVELDQTPFRVLLREDVDLKRDALITEVQENDEVLLLALRDKSPDTPGRIRVVLSKGEPLQLKEWITTDAQGLDTRVEVVEATRDVEIDPKKFVIKSPGDPFRQ